MSSSNRRLARATRHGSGVRSALARAQQAIAALEGVKLENLAEVIQQLEAQTARAGQLADALADDYESLVELLEVQREVTLRLCAAAAGSSDHLWRDLENQTRARVIEERELRSAESSISKEA